jgi:hypothetical protein
MNNHVLVRPLFRVLYGIVSIFCVGGICLVLFSLAIMWHDNELKVLGLLAWCAFIGFLFLSIFIAYTGFIIAKSGKLPKCLDKYKELNKNI